MTNLNKYIDYKSRSVGISPTFLRRLKSEMVAYLHENDNGFVVYEFYQGYDRFIEYIENLISQNLNNHNSETIRVIAYTMKIEKHDLEYMMKYV